MIETERLILRAYREDDREAFAAVNAHPQVAAAVGRGLDRAGSDGLMDDINAHIARHGFGLWGAERRADGRLVGFIGLRVVPETIPVSPAVEMGWRLHPDAWGGGLATEGARAALAWAFANLAQDEIIAFTATNNLRSQKVMGKLGMVRTPERDFDHPWLAEDHPLRRHVVFVARRPAP